ncbi:hypothetical protein A2960_01160 [Candidatus Gottesmanbacteria bacterium RIFCSPLOWO2_01_FULL_39_12b]|uniref:BioF2-like acetyltransferase domain-containing protein n=1 Tax=Candidatus Gottesmanbacteria bacterium RIFCSPLOWO2_01_FULL_39_12b TaxID=1798388 RepID=A0A1F6AQ02_9BACT|nr:MAG: hypothetical protein A2960_01160 [Candidatus Gottesmanbacteria bacterium RIFCSPLOWO2_01_FULL_39_12b]
MLQIKDIDNKKIWEKFITKNSPQSVFQSWNWGETIKKCQMSNVKCQMLWRLGVYDKDNLIGIAQVIKVKAKKGTFLHLRHGPVLSLWKKEYFESLFTHLKSLGKKENAFFIRISPLLPESKDNRNFFRRFGFIHSPIHRMDGEVCWVLDLTKSEVELLSGMRKTTRYLIRQAEKLGVKIVKSTDLADIDEFLKLYDTTAKRHHFVRHTGIKEEFTEFLKDDNIMLFKGYYANKLLSAALIIFYNYQAIYHHSASIEQKIPVNYLLQWEIIKEAKNRGKKIYNLWGVAPNNNPRHPWKGLTLFKQGFGGKQLEYLHAMDYPLSIKYCATYLIEYLRKLYKGY